MKDVQDWITVHRLYKNGMPKKKIAKELNMSKNTVKKLINIKKEPKYSRTLYPTKIFKYKDLIDLWYLDPNYDFNGTRIFKELQKRGYKNSISPIYTYLKKLKENKTHISKRATVRIETPLGDQAQFDWSPYKMNITNKIQTVYCFTLILSASRKKAIVFSLKDDAVAIYEAIQELFQDLGGVTKEIIIDNPRALVLENMPKKEPKYNINALRLAMHLNIELNACAPYRARTKGKIEKPYQYIEEQFVKGNSFKSMEELNRNAKAFIDEWNNKVHGTTKRIPNQVFIEELPTLIPLPKNKFIHIALEKRKVSLDSLVSFESNKYSIPVKYVEKTVLVRKIYGYKIEIYTVKMELIETYEIKETKGLITRNEEHYAAINQAVTKSIPAIKRQFESDFKYGKTYLEMAKNVIQQPNYHAREILKLKELYRTENIDLILSYCIDHQIFKINEIKKVILDKYLEIVSANYPPIVKLNDINENLIRDISYYDRSDSN